MKLIRYTSGLRPEYKLSGIPRARDLFWLPELSAPGPVP